jgi:putative oxidoreductase
MVAMFPDHDFFKLIKPKSMKELLFTTKDNWTATIVRLMLGVVMFPHGAQKMLGWFGGYGFSGTMDFFTNTMGLPWIISFLVITIEFFGAIMLIFGLATRLLGALFCILMGGIIFTSHLDYGFFMNWFGNQKGEGIEYFLLVIGMALSLLVAGGGSLSLDRLISYGITAKEDHY